MENVINEHLDTQVPDDDFNLGTVIIKCMKLVELLSGLTGAEKSEMVRKAIHRFLKDRDLPEIGDNVLSGIIDTFVLLDKNQLKIKRRIKKCCLRIKL